MQIERPKSRQVANPRAAEELAADWMRYLGFPDAKVSPGGADGGVDVHAQHGLAQVKTRAAPTGAPALRELFGARGTATRKRLLFFSASSYSKPAFDFASKHGIALFVYDLFGDVQPANALARMMLRAADRPARQPGQATDLADGEYQLPPKPRASARQVFEQVLGAVFLLVILAMIGLILVSCVAAAVS